MDPMTEGAGPIGVLAILQARVSSSRLRGKVLADLCGAPMIVRQIERLQRARLIDRLVVATSLDPSDAPLVDVVEARGVRVLRGSLRDVLDRFASVARTIPSTHVVRLTGDCPLADPNVIDAVIAHHWVGAGDITTNSVEPSLPDGLDVEVMRRDVLLAAAQEARLDLEREHVTQFIYRRPERFRIHHYRSPRDWSGMRWTVDEPADLAFVRAVFEALYPAKPDFGLYDVLTLLRERPDLPALNSHLMRNEALARQVAQASSVG
jgi:spore coat polysaccharide biosynthesis protein SpsF